MEKFGFKRIETNGRITRDSLEIVDTGVLEQIIEKKQRYFSSKWLPYRTILNDSLLKVIMRYGKEKCYLWTAANKERVKSILKYYPFDKYFKDIIFDDKGNNVKSINTLKQITNSNKLVIYENNHEFFKDLKFKVVDNICDDWFTVYAYKLN